MFKNKKLIIFATIVLIAVVFATYQSTQKPSVKYTDKDELSKALPAHECLQDSDCILTGSGACGGEACPLAINKQYKTIWESTPDSKEHENICALVGVCVPSGMENYTAKCVNNICEALSKT